LDPKLWWYIARASGLTAWWISSATIAHGMLLSSRILGPRATPARLLDLHRFLSILSAVFLTTHLLTLFADQWVDIGPLQVLVPFTSSYRPGAVAWGVTAFYLLAAVLVTSLLKARIPAAWWRSVHRVAFAVFILVTVHALTAGTDTTATRATALVLGGALTFLGTYRLLRGRHATTTTPPAPPPSTSDIALAESPAPPSDQRVRVTELRWAADDVLAVTVSAVDGGHLPAWEPGAHVDLVLPSGKARQYSLCGDPADRGHYRVGVLRVPGGRGGSTEVHQLHAGQTIAARGPRNTFPLVLADSYLFVAGGIGITALLPMIRRVEDAGMPWRLVYGGRSRDSMAFTDELLSLTPGRVHLVPQDTDGLPDLVAALNDTQSGAAVYCCGPEPLIAALERTIAADFPDRHLHVERFGPLLSPAAGTQQHPPAAVFEVELARSGQVLPVPADRSLLAVIRDVVPGAPSSCEQGFCGSCEVRVLAGTPEHRDDVLPAGQRDRTDLIYPCVSRSRSPRLVVDL
jgi:ferredoxin-NADP reductase/DMSO/TMAO reductase YedYZ heme-binding membrane subunit